MITSVSDGVRRLITPHFRALVRAYKSGLLKVILEDGQLKFGRPNWFRDLINSVDHGNQNMMVWFLEAQLAGGGLRVYCPNHIAVGALSVVEPSLPGREYQQPFLTFIVDMGSYFGDSATAPLFVVGHRAADVLITAVVKRNFDLTFGCFDLDDRSLSDHIGFLAIDEHARSVFSEVDRQAFRVFVNGSMLVTQSGRCVGSANEQHAAKLTERLKKNKRPELRDSTEAELRSIPIVYEIDQKVKLWTERSAREVGDSDSTKDVGRVLGPHFRHGHWRREVGYREILAAGGVPTRRYIGPVFVNAHLFGGDMGDTQVSYE